MIGEALSPFQILKVLVLREYRGSCHHCDYNEEAKGLDHIAKYADFVPIAMQEALRIFGKGKSFLVARIRLGPILRVNSLLLSP